jgi:hypothetical protein
MKQPSFLSSRRTGLAAAAGLALSAVWRQSAAEAPAEASFLTCCGNGPPDPRKGLGIRVQPTPRGKDRSFEFTNQVTGEENPKWWWVFAVGDGIVVDRYIELLTGINQPVTSYPVTTPLGPATAFAVDSGFLLALTWPSGITPIFYTRPIAKSE